MNSFDIFLWVFAAFNTGLVVGAMIDSDAEERKPVAGPLGTALFVVWFILLLLKHC